MSPPGGQRPEGSVGAHEQRSLFGEILDWMLAPLLLLWPMSLGLTWVVAQAIAARPYDRELSDVVRALARQATVQAGSGLLTPAEARAELAVEGLVGDVLRDEPGHEHAHRPQQQQRREHPVEDLAEQRALLLRAHHVA